MEPEPAREGDPDASLTGALGVLASPVRLALLREIRTPKTLGEIKLHAPGPGDEDPDRILARQTVKEHLDRLVEIGVVVARPATRDRRATVEYVVNHQSLYSLSETFRALARLRPVQAPEGETIHAKAAPRAFALASPCLILVKGLDEGTRFDLGSRAQGPRQWVIGRQRGLAVCLDFDAYVSSENSRVLLEDGRFVIEDLPVSRNGTLLNFQPLPRGGRAPLSHGDLIGVGRSLLLFRA